MINKNDIFTNKNKKDIISTVCGEHEVEKNKFKVLKFKNTKTVITDLNQKKT